MGYADLVAKADRVALRELGGEPVTYAPQVGAPVVVTGIFDAQYVLAKGSAEAGVEMRVPAVFLRLEDLPTDPEQDDPTITIGAAPGRTASLVGNYRVREHEPDGMGGIVLGLHKIT